MAVSGKILMRILAFVNAFFLSIILSSNAAAETGAEDISQIGSVCVNIPRTKAAVVLKKMRERGIKIKEYPENTCSYWGNETGEYQGFDVPEGLEGWTVRTLRAMGYNARHAIATSGGGGENKLRVKRSYIFDREITPQNYKEMVSDIQCKLNKRFSKYFEHVSIKNKCKSDVDEHELCWNIWLGGHLATSKGVQGNDLRAQIDQKYWFSTRLELFIGDFFDYPDVKGGSQVARIDFFVQSTRFARAPAEKPPERTRYHPIEYFEPQLDGDEVDDLVGWAIRENVIRAGQFTCGRSGK